MLKAILFDIDGVLLDSFEANLKFYQDLMIKAGYRPLTREELSAVFHLTMVDAIKKLTGLTDEAEIKKVWNIYFNHEVEYPTAMVIMPEGIEEVIETLSKKYKLGIVTSRVKNYVYDSPGLKKLEKCFKVAVAYEDTAEHKPSGEPLLFAAEKLGLKPVECVYVGDAETDIIAARAAGMKVIMYSKNKFNQADASINDFKKLPEMIKGLNL